MFRKFFAAFVAMVLVVGGLFAEELQGVFKKFEDGKATIEVDGKEMTYKVSPDAKTKFKKEEILLTEAFGKMKVGKKGNFTVENDIITKISKSK